MSLQIGTGQQLQYITQIPTILQFKMLIYSWLYTVYQK